MNVVGDIRAGLATAHKDWGWFMALGIALVVLGILAIVYESSATLASITALGIIILIAGIAQIVAVFQSRNAGHIILYLLFGALEIFVGFSLIRYPLAGTLTVTLLLSVYLVFAGIFRFVYALWAQFPQYGWAVFSGIISVILGVLLWMQWPFSALWFIGFAVGLSFIFAGIAWCGFAMKLRALPA
ncbi:MAG: DUF308 domain-containing protein [Candidatus Eremiobacteraeota bacterium]|nr:DUF308 domain-containing protein [Candidatus Eremiobacteraeota bacterium]